MKNIITGLILSMLAVAGLQARDGQQVAISGQQIERVDGQMAISFSATIDRSASRGGKTYVVAPLLTDGSYRWSLPAVVVQGPKAVLATLRHEWAGREEALAPVFGPDAVMAERGEAVEYKTSVEWQPWMDSADLVAETMTIGCCSWKRGETAVIRKGTPTVAASKPTEVPEVKVAVPEDIKVLVVPKKEDTVFVPTTTAEKIAAEYTFVAPKEEFEQIKSGQILFDEDKESSIMVMFRRGQRKIEPAMDDNAEALDRIITSINTIRRSSDSDVAGMVIAGFASPDGGFEVNDRLAFDRSVALKRYIMDHTGLQDSKILLHNGSEDWRGLRREVENSNMPSKEDVLWIIDNVPVWDSQTQRGREGELMRLDGGLPYKHMFRYFFPKLRNAAYIKIYYENIN